jgi:hypothetical protein
LPQVDSASALAPRQRLRRLKARGTAGRLEARPRPTGAHAFGSRAKGKGGIDTAIFDGGAILLHVAERSEALMPIDRRHAL